MSLTLFRQVPGGFEPVDVFETLDEALAASAAFDGGWQVEQRTETGVCIVASCVIEG